MARVLCLDYTEVTPVWVLQMSKLILIAGSSLHLKAKP